MCGLLFGNVPYWLLNEGGQRVQPLFEEPSGPSIVLDDWGFRSVEGIPDNRKLCQKGTWNERMCVEAMLSMVTVICDLKHIRHRLPPNIHVRLAWMVTMFNVLLSLFHHPDADPFQISIAKFTKKTRTNGYRVIKKKRMT